MGLRIALEDSHIGYADYGFSDSGLLLYQPETRPTNLATLEWIDRSGASQPSSLPPRRYAEQRLTPYVANLRLSPDGRHAAVIVTSVAGSVDVWISDLAHGALSRLNSQGVNYQPVWSPDGNRVAFYSAGRAAPVSTGRRPMEAARRNCSWQAPGFLDA